MHLLRRRRRLIQPLSAAHSRQMAVLVAPRAWCPLCMLHVRGPLSRHLQRAHA